MSEQPERGVREDADREEAPIPAIPADQPIVPNYMAGEGPRLVTLRRMPVMEAEMAKAKLEAEGILCFVVDSTMALAQPLTITPACLQVAETDVPIAEEILSRPVADGADGEYADEDWRCPKCHRKAVELMPLSPGLRRVRNTLFLLVGAQIAGRLIGMGIPAGDLLQSFDSIMQLLLLPWLFSVFVLGLWWLLSKRTKRCQQCNHEWSDTAAERAS